jgi:hypothetical protein
MFAHAGETVSRQVLQKPEAYSMESVEDFLAPRTMQIARHQ